MTSVCTGAFILGVAGVLQGRRATTHRAFTELLPPVGATHERARVVKDGDVITAGGVTSGIDFGLDVVAEIAGETVALAGELGMPRLQAHCHLGLGKLYRRIGRPDESRAELSTAAAMLREMGMTYWLPEAEAELAAASR